MSVCREPGCGARCVGPYCAAHPRAAELAYDRRRGSPSKRGYGRRWERLRKLVLARDPLCKVRENLINTIASLRAEGRYSEAFNLSAHLPHLCDGTRLSTDADHRIPKSAGGQDTMENLQGACHEDHSYKTATMDSNFARRLRQTKKRG